MTEQSVKGVAKINSRQMQKLETQKRILTSAFNIYSEKGFSISSEEIAQKAEVAKGTIFLHFASIDNLITTISKKFSEQLTTELHARANKEKDLYSFLETHIDILSANENYYTNLITSLDDLSEETQLIFRGIQSAVSYHLLEVLQFQSNIITVPHYMIFNTWIGLLHYYLQNRRIFETSPNESLLNTNKEEIIKCFMFMIRKDEQNE